ncbi:hypothetical protein Lal_00012319 [Lupinus albus]|uniref:Putative F-box domain-containing protein n=1 Tax=Lupinus albus TaxID=3870 RepID=A0A6A5MI02_LUPAL|nr:putative F-box domain-containing protein [Lupinus albus]KAF1872098.1 hypothetical protein Lal_00012319 [Lupinus albus]
MSFRNKFKPPWSSLCIDILLNISNRLEFIDHLRFRSVCSSFHAVNPLPLHPMFPLLPFPIKLNNNHDNLEGHFSLIEVTTLNIQPLKSNNKCWLIKVEASQEEVGGKVHLKMLNQLSSYYLDDYLKELPESLDLLRNRVSFVSKGYYLKQEETSLDEEDNQDIQRVFVSSMEDDFVVMTMHSNGKISVWRKGDEKWTHIDNGLGQCEDIVLHKGKFYAVDKTGLTVTVDKEFNVTKVASSLPRSKHDYGYGKVLVEIEGELYLLLKYRKRNVKKDGSSGIFPYGFEGYKLNEEKLKWVRIYKLKDVVLFLDPHCAFSISSKNFPTYKKNSIYVSFDELYYGNFVGGYPLFDMRDCSTKTLSSVRSIFVNFWPPPKWI